MEKKDKKIIIAGGIKTFTAIGTGVLGITAVLINSVECLTVSPCFSQAIRVLTVIVLGYDGVHCIISCIVNMLPYSFSI